MAKSKSQVQHLLFQKYVLHVSCWSSDSKTNGVKSRWFRWKLMAAAAAALFMFSSQNWKEQNPWRPMKECTEDPEPVLTWHSERPLRSATSMKEVKKQPWEVHLIRRYHDLEKRARFTIKLSSGAGIQESKPRPALKEKSLMQISALQSQPSFHHKVSCSPGQWRPRNRGITDLDFFDQ